MDCRFCLSPFEDADNPLISPCMCIGSVKYVHVNCLRQWREMTENPEASYRCQLCLKMFDMYLRWPIEYVPDYRSSRGWFLYYKPFAISCFLYLMNGLISAKNQETPDNLILFYLYDNRSGPFFIYTLLSITVAYFIIYVQHLNNVRSKHTYAQYWLKNDIYNTNPRNLLCHTIFNLILACVYTYPFGVLYIFALPRLFVAHVNILQKMNIDSQMF